MQTATLLAEGYDYAIYAAESDIEIRSRHDDSVLSHVTGADADDLKNCIASIQGGLLSDITVNEQAIDLLSAAAA